VEFLSDLNVKPPLHEQMSPYRRLSGNSSAAGSESLSGMKAVRPF